MNILVNHKLKTEVAEYKIKNEPAAIKDIRSHKYKSSRGTPNLIMEDLR